MLSTVAVSYYRSNVIHGTLISIRSSLLIVLVQSVFLYSHMLIKDLKLAYGGTYSHASGLRSPSQNLSLSAS